MESSCFIFQSSNSGIGPFFGRDSPNTQKDFAPKKWEEQRFGEKMGRAEIWRDSELFKPMGLLRFLFVVVDCISLVFQIPFEKVFAGGLAFRRVQTPTHKVSGGFLKTR